MAGSLTRALAARRSALEGEGADTTGTDVAFAKQQLLFNQFSVVLALGIGLVFYFVFIQSPWLIAGMAWLVIFFFLIGAARRHLDRDTMVPIGVGLLLGNWMTALVITAVAPFSYPAGILQIIIPVIAGGPVLNRRTLRAATIGAAIFTCLVCVIGLGLEDSLLNDAVNEDLQDVIMIFGMPIMIISIAIGAFDARQRQERALRRSRINNEKIRESRQRLVTAADEERNRIERDLHDGAQQHLVALSMQLRLLRSTSDLSDEIDPLVDDLEAAMVSLRELAHGIYPPLLRSRGLSEAISAAARRNPLKIDVDVEDRRFDPAVEAGLYFCCIEALQNAAKHAGEDAHVRVHIREVDGTVHGEVQDNGPGFTAASEHWGNGLRNMEDRIVALGGDFAITNDGGTRVSFSVPTRVAGSRADAPSSAEPTEYPQPANR